MSKNVKYTYSTNGIVYKTHMFVLYKRQTHNVIERGYECYEQSSIPNIRKIFIKRFEKAEKTITPGNPNTWKTAKDCLFALVGNFESKYIDIITDLCHMNIRAIFDCLQLILSNRVWCQESKIVSEYPDIKVNKYNFNNIVNVLRTLSCGENSVYTGQMNLQFNASDLEDMQQRPAFDGIMIVLIQ